MIYIVTGLLLISLYINYNLYSKITPLENAISKGLILEEEFLKYYDAILYLLVSAKTEMDKIDGKGTFSSDDDVGFAFKVIQTAINNLVLKMKQLGGKTNDEE
jgi:hypothetical protein